GRQVGAAAGQGAELRVNFDERRVRINVELERPVGALLDICREFADEAIAKIALVDRAAGKLVRNLECRDALGERLRAGEREGKAGDGAGNEATACDVHGFPPGAVYIVSPACKVGILVYRKA